MIHVEAESQAALFPKQEKIKKLQAKVDNAYSMAAIRLKESVELGKFFKVFGEYCGMLNGTGIEDIDNVILENIRAGRAQAIKIRAILDSAENKMNEAHEMIAEINAIEHEINNPNQPPSETEDDSDYHPVKDAAKELSPI